MASKLGKEYKPRSQRLFKILIATLLISLVLGFCLFIIYLITIRSLPQSQDIWQLINAFGLCLVTYSIVIVLVFASLVATKRFYFAEKPGTMESKIIATNKPTMSAKSGTPYVPHPKRLFAILIATLLISIALEFCIFIVFILTLQLVPQGPEFWPLVFAAVLCLVFHHSLNFIVLVYLVVTRRFYFVEIGTQKEVKYDGGNSV